METLVLALCFTEADGNLSKHISMKSLFFAHQKYYLVGNAF